MNRGILELKSDTRILQTDALFRNKRVTLWLRCLQKRKFTFVVITLEINN